MDILWRYFVEKGKCGFVEISEKDSKNFSYYPRVVFVMDGQSYRVMVTIYTMNIRFTETAQELNKRKRKDFKEFLTKVGEI